ncbi:ACP S-malonyltransferase [Kibdelosporangium persicum]|uniref:Malonyl CoA-acyl carrier protein transacylase n=1 Tax=Kibdelosporangium persicum TaxID=2698649 RepID=A0ABX2F7G5_9PSEU|nr:ACP S-malonyltransferase [Kibdelosporangium persicum]NRN67296.1 Malonyl CoA-acyl carrier protein transacylase [Kibdelosporangium persicum]
MTGQSEAQRTAVVFPGMGKFDFGSAGRFLVLDRYARARLSVADEVLGLSVLGRFDTEDTAYSEYAQLAFVIASLAAADRAEDRFGMRPEVCVGASFGQKAAAAYTGSLDFVDVVRLTVDLARCEREYFAAEYADVVTHAVYRVPDEPFHGLLDEMRARGQWFEISGTLDRGFYMISLRESALEDFIQAVRDLGGYSMYTMRPPVHASAFGALRAKAEAEVFSRYRIEPPKLTVVSDADGAVVNSADAMRTMLLDTFDRAIRWPDIVGTLAGLGVDTLWFTGPDDMFHRLDCTVRNFDVVAINPRNALRPGSPKRKLRTA